MDISCLEQTCIMWDSPWQFLFQFFVLEILGLLVRIPNLDNFFPRMGQGWVDIIATGLILPAQLIIVCDSVKMGK